MSAATVLIVEDERVLARAIRLFLADHGYEAEVAPSGEEALAVLERMRPDVVFADVRLPGMSGLELLARLREFDASIPVVIMTAHGTIEGAVEAVKRGAFDYVKKPVDLEELRLMADRARENTLLREELSYYRGRALRAAPFTEVIGESPAFRAVLERARQVAALADTPPVLLTGETGTGKGLVARTIHAAGPRAGRPFIDVNCTALPATLMEAELFGYERGAFTDAKQSKMGLFEAGEGGFLFLDEIGDLEPALQGKLLRAIEERVVRRVGGVRDRQVDVRIITATNRDLEREAADGRFRKDLYFRLAVIVLRLPPLRERGDDVCLLAERFLERFNRKYHKALRAIDPEALELLRAYAWPGNVRELSHVIERAVLWSQGAVLEPDHLSLTMPAEAAGAPAVPLLPPEGTDLAQWERSVLEQALRAVAGNQTRAAQRLGITRDTLRYRLKKYGL